MILIPSLSCISHFQMTVNEVQIKNELLRGFPIDENGRDSRTTNGNQS